MSQPEPYWRRRYNRLMAQGRCTVCGHPKQEDRRTLTECLACAGKRNGIVPVMTERICPICGGVFMGKGGQKFDTPDCQRAHRRQANREMSRRWRSRNYDLSRVMNGPLVDLSPEEIERRIAQAEAQIKYERAMGLREGVEAYAWQRRSDPVQDAAGADPVDGRRTASPKRPRQGGMEAA